MRNDHADFEKGITEFLASQNTDKIVHLLKELERRIRELEFKINEK